MSAPQNFRRSAILLLVAVLAATAVSQVTAAEFLPERKPNFLVILADDLGLADVSAYGTSDVRTPHIDRIYREGLTFENFYANSCVCSPTRAALLTGCYPDRVGVPGVIRTKPEENWGYLAADAMLLPQVLKRAGYHSAIVGKWHLGLDSPNTPTERGFDYFDGFLGDMMSDYWTHRREGQNYMRRNREVVDPQGHATDLFTNGACAYLEERAKAGTPFFLYLAYNAPHDPIQPPPEWLAKVREREPASSEARVKLVALIEHMDDGIGRVLAALDRLQLAENTLVVFTSDNGGLLSTGANNGPWRSGKTHMYEGGLRVAGAARWPAKVRPGSRTQHIAVSMDIFPTLCAAAGVEPPPGIDGVSFLPTLSGQEQRHEEREIYFVRREGGEAYGGKTIEALRRGDWKLIQDSPFGPQELYNLRSDPGETTDLAKKEKKVFREMGAALRGHIQRGGQTPWQK